MTASTNRSPRRQRLVRAGLTTSAALALLATAVGTASPASAATRPRAENGERCTIVGTAGKDTLRGTNGRDVICGLGGNDVIKGLGGNDVIDGGDGKDKIQGGSGNDRIYGGAGKDTLSGDAGHDYLDGDTSADKLTGGSGDDVLSGGTNNDSLNGGSGADGLMGSSGRDTYVGSSGDDRCTFVVGEDASRSSCVGDQSAPQVLGMTVTKTSVDSRSGDAKVTVSVQARDDMVAYVDMHLVGTGALSGTTLSGTGSWDEPSSGSPKNGTWTSTFTIPQGTPSGSFDVVVEASDGLHVTPTKKVYRSAVKNTGATFTQPTVTSFSTSAGSAIDTSKGTQKVTFKATISDPQQRATKYADLSMVSVTGQTTVDLDGSLTRTGGTATNGTWTTSRTFTQGNWPTDEYDWVLKTTSKEGRTTTWVGPTLWETTYKGKPGYKLLPGAETFQVVGNTTANHSAPEMSSMSLPTTVTVGTNGSSVPFSLDVSDPDDDDRLQGYVYLQSVEHPDVWFEGRHTSDNFEEQSNVGTMRGSVYVKSGAPRGEYRVWVLLTDGGSGQAGHNVWYGPAGSKPPAHVTTKGTVTINPLTADMTTNGTTITLK